MLFQVLCGFEPIFYTTHPNEESIFFIFLAGALHMYRLPLYIWKAKSAYISNEKSVDFVKSLAYNDIKAESLLRNLRSVMHNTKGGMPT